MDTKEPGGARQVSGTSTSRHQHRKLAHCEATLQRLDAQRSLLFATIQELRRAVQPAAKPSQEGIEPGWLLVPWSLARAVTRAQTREERLQARAALLEYLQPPEEAEDEALECRYCGEPGHACVEDLALDDEEGLGGGVWLRLFTSQRSGPLRMRLGRPGDVRIDERTCAGCGCTDSSACPEGCAWSRAELRSVVAPDGSRFVFQVLLCSACVDDMAEAEAGAVPASEAASEATSAPTADRPPSTVVDDRRHPADQYRWYADVYREQVAMTQPGPTRDLYEATVLRHQATAEALDALREEVIELAGVSEDEKLGWPEQLASCMRQPFIEGATREAVATTARLAWREAGRTDPLTLRCWHPLEDLQLSGATGSACRTCLEEMDQTLGGRR